MTRTDLGRIAFREEGDLWNAYHAPMNSMDDATLLGSIKMSLVRGGRKEQFMKLMKDCLGDIIKEVTGHKPSWDPSKPAPDHERTKKYDH